MIQSADARTSVSRSGPRPRYCGLAFLRQELVTPVLRVAALGPVGAERPLLAEGHDGDAIDRYALGHQIVHRGLGPPLTERQIVFRGAPLIAVYLDEQEVGGIAPEPVRAGVENPRIAGTDDRLVEVEVDRLEIVVRRVLLGRSRC